MNLHKLYRTVSAFSAAVLICTGALGTQTVSAENNNKKIASKVEADALKSEDEMLSKIRNNKWWKADLSDYNEKFSIIGYETIKVPENKPKPEDSDDGVVINDTGISYIEPHSDYQAIELIYDDTEYEDSSVQQPSKDSGNITVEPGSFVFTTYGYGHGVGMSQNGANHYALYSGWSYDQILDHYYPGTVLKKKKIKDGDKLTAGGVSGSVSDIVSMVTYNEIGGSMSFEAIKAQAVAVYTYIMYKGGNAPDLCPKSDPPQNVKDAVNSVLGEALYYDGSYALAMFSASSGGSSSSCYDIFYQDIPYLRSVFCDYDSDYDPNYGLVDVISEDEVRSELEKNLGITLSDNPENWISLIGGDGGYVSEVIVDNQVTIKGNDFRAYLGLRSPKFDFEYHSKE